MSDIWCPFGDHRSGFRDSPSVELADYYSRRGFSFHFGSGATPSSGFIESFSRPPRRLSRPDVASSPTLPHISVYHATGLAPQFRPGHFAWFHRNALLHVSFRALLVAEMDAMLIYLLLMQIDCGIRRRRDASDIFPRHH
jgi:hypothetical protein